MLVVTPAVPSRSSSSARSGRATRTKSYFAGRRSAMLQNASRSALLTRLRSTAPPILRLADTPSLTSRSSVVLAREGVEDEEAGGIRRSVAVDPVELAAARETPASLRRHLYGQALPAFAAPALEDRPAAAGAHPCPESVGLCPLPLLRLVGALHSASQYTDAPENFCSAFATGHGIEPTARRYGRPRVQGDSDRQQLDSLWQEVQRRLRASVPDSTFNLWLRPLQVLGARGTTLHLSAPDSIRSWVERRYATLIGEALEAAGAALSEISFAPVRGPATRRAAATSIPATPSSAS